MSGKWLNVFAGILAILLVLTTVSVDAILFSPADERSIAVQEQPNWVYFNVTRLGGGSHQLGINKLDAGYIGLGKDSQYIGYMFLMSGFKHPVSGNWYICPMYGLNATYDIRYGADYIEYNGTGDFLCYRKDNFSLTTWASFSINLVRFLIDSEANIKITADMNVTSAITPSNTGFAFVFVPVDESKFKYAMVNGSLELLNSSSRVLPVDKEFEFYDAQARSIGQRFNWNDMSDGDEEVMSKIIQFDGYVGIAVGQVGLGAGKHIYVDPIYTVDYTPIPAVHLLNGTVNVYNDSQFTQANITNGISDSSDATSYDTYRSYVPSFTWTNDNGIVQTSQVSAVDGVYSDVSHQFSASKWGILALTGGAKVYNGTSLKVYVSPKVVPDASKSIVATNLAGTVTYASFVTPATVTYEWRNLTLANIPAGGIDTMYFHDGGAAIVNARYDYVQLSTPVAAGRAIVGKWAQTFLSDWMWWLRVRKTSAGTASMRVYAYDNNESIATAQYIDDTLLGTGWFNINVSSLMEYENNTSSLNYTKLRFYSDNKHSFSELYLRAEYNDTQLPSFSNCFINDTVLIVNEFARLQCNVTDDLDVDHVNGTIEGVEYQFTKDDDVYYYDFQCLSENPSVDWTLADARDIAGNYNSISPSLSFSCSIPTLSIFYQPFVQKNAQTTIYATVTLNGTVYPNATLTIFIDGSNATMTYNNTTDSYMVYWIPTVAGTYDFSVNITGTYPLSDTGTIVVTEDHFEVCISLWNDINMSAGSRYLNEFAWIYAIMPERSNKEALSHLFEEDEAFACPPQGDPTCYWHGKYENGTACIDLYLAGNYTFYIIGNNIRWEQDIGSGFVKDCKFCPPVEIQKRLLLPLGDFYLDEAENIDIYTSEQELYYRGLFYGALSSWLMAGIMFIVAVVAFVGVLWATGSLKSAIAALVLLPTIIWMLVTFTL